MNFLIDAATYYKAEPHQDAAWEYLWDSLDEYTQDSFKEAYRTAQEPSTASVVFTLNTFEQLTGYSSALFDEEEVVDCNALFTASGFAYDPSLAAMLMANILHETGNLKWMSELSDGSQYEGRTDLGNTEPGDGPRFRGAGVLQLTGRYNYAQAAEMLDDKRVMEGCDYVSATYPYQSALPWIESNNLLDIAKTEGFDAVCYRINGGFNGYDDRVLKHDICKKVFGV